MRKPLSEVAASADVARRSSTPLLDRHLENLREFKTRAKLEGKVVHTDLGGLNTDSFNKFIPYYLFPEATYTVTVSHSPSAPRSRWAANPWRFFRPAHPRSPSQLCGALRGAAVTPSSAR